MILRDPVPSDQFDGVYGPSCRKVQDLL